MIARLVIIVSLLVCTASRAATQTDAADPRICYASPSQIPRDADGSIRRSSAARAAFMRMHPCPSSGLTRGACPGWQIDHVIPLACGGCDEPANMQWLPASIKSAARADAKDRWERTVYCGQPKP
jgi:5-methylcytosine-specific restriction endonuclease McrA